ncbi:MAG TPA: hypothetical protein VJ728_14980 [Candidatus Binataceae bacterium]|nr:hypothetical protein [Candidatus Binataceae bacterium]
MSLELIAILLTAFLQVVGIVIIARMERENARMLEHIEGDSAVRLLPGHQMKEVLDEIRRFLLTETGESAR